jgi:hypothetical protein
LLDLEIETVALFEKYSARRGVRVESWRSIFIHLVELKKLRVPYFQVILEKSIYLKGKVSQAIHVPQDYQEDLLKD